MLAARDDAHPAIVNLLLELIRDEHDDHLIRRAVLAKGAAAH